MDTTYKNLETQMVSYNSLIKVAVSDNGESFSSLKRVLIPYGYLAAFNDMEKVLSKKILVRKSVYEKLINAQNLLQTINPSLSLFVTYGYRSLEVQIKRFLERVPACSEIYYENPTELYEEVHRSVAVPSVAGHPTGGAIDITIIDIKTKCFLDFGTKQYDYTTKDFYTFAPNISKLAKENRMLLRNVMLESDFAPFDGEWWHFSYGDREWAYYYQKPYALYEQKKLEEVKRYL